MCTPAWLPTARALVWLCEITSCPGMETKFLSSVSNSRLSHLSGKKQLHGFFHRNIFAVLSYCVVLGLNLSCFSMISYSIQTLKLDADINNKAIFRLLGLC